MQQNQPVFSVGDRAPNVVPHPDKVPEQPLEEIDFFWRRIDRAELLLQVFGGDFFSVLTKFLAQRFANLPSVQVNIGTLSTCPVSLDQLADRAGVGNPLKANISDVRADNHVRKSQ